MKLRELEYNDALISGPLYEDPDDRDCPAHYEAAHPDTLSDKYPLICRGRTPQVAFQELAETIHDLNEEDD